ncbi:MAG TPA: helix-turn-helix transcriptional regulator, partial [Metabacillus sp.]|nr:helix-turn-helix transcriptional regulator [Metabacillus sp.]
RGRKLLEYALKNLAEELIIGEDNYGIHIQLEDNLSLIILTLDKDQPIMIDSLITNCELYIESCNRWFNCDLSCYIGNSLGVEFMHEEVNRLKFLEKNNVQFDNKVFFLNTGSSPHNEIEMPQMVPWMTMLKKGTNDQLMKEIEIYLKEIKGINATFLRQFHQNLTQMVFFVLNIKGIQAHQLYSDSKSVELSERATKSIKEMMEWVNHIIQKATIQTDMVEQTNTIVQAVKNYIVLNIDDCELSRKDIAGHVFLNEDYLSKLFKKEEGIPLSTFIMEQRMDLAKKLLNTTNMPIGEVASAVGHSNFSHFSKIFRKHTGLNPKDFRHSKTTS